MTDIVERLRTRSLSTRPDESDLRADLNEAADLLSQLPLTADGVRITSAMQVFRYGTGTMEFAITELRCHRGGHCDVWDAYYSTKEAALAAAESAKERGNA